MTKKNTYYRVIIKFLLVAYSVKQSPFCRLPTRLWLISGDISVDLVNNDRNVIIIRGKIAMISKAEPLCVL